jgi:hypothetical protein
VSWGSRKPKVELRVTRFLPEVAPATPAGLTDEQRAAHRQRRAAECAIPTRPDGLISADGRFRWSAGWAQWVPLSDQAASLPRHDGPAILAKDNARSQMRCHCGWCATCFTLAQYMSDWRKAKKLSEL